MQINVHSRADPPKYFSKPVWFRYDFTGHPVFYFVAAVVQSVFDCRLVIDVKSCSDDSTGRPIIDRDHSLGLTVYIDGQDNINREVDERLAHYAQDYVHSVYPNVDIWIDNHNSFALDGIWETQEELWSVYNFFGHGPPADLDPHELENIRMGIA